MENDLNLSRALGGLRIANQDDGDSPDNSNSTSSHPAPATNLRPSTTISQSQEAQAPTTPTKEPVDVMQASQEGNTSRRQQSFRPPVLSNSSTRDGESRSTYSGQRPSSTTYSAPAALDPEDLETRRQSRRISTRSSIYETGSGLGSQSTPSQHTYIPARESSQRGRQYMSRPSETQTNNAHPPTRRSSRGMASGYAAMEGSVTPSQPLSYKTASDMPLPASSEEWKDRGAAIGVRRELDANGKPILRHVKKGVRDFSFGRILGEGSYSTVFLATDRQTLKEYAVKVLEKKHIIKEKKIKYVNIEKNTLNRLTEHPGIVRLYYTFQDETSLYYVLDLCVGGELLGVLKRTGTFDVECTRFYGAQILDAIDYMHSRGVIHRDLKPENVLLDDQMHVKITDFGTAKLLPDPRELRPKEGSDRGLPEPSASVADESKRAASFVGTAEYVSPELLTNKSACKASDLWAFGCIIYQLLAGRPPFKAGSEYLTFQKIVNLDYEFPIGFPPAARDLVERCLVLDPVRRLTIEHIKNHEFFDGQQFGKSLWRMKAPRLRPYQRPVQEPSLIHLSGQAAASSSSPAAARSSQTQGNVSIANGNSRPSGIITELPPPTQLDIEWSPVLTRANERILKLGDLMVVSTPLPNSPHAKGGDHSEGHKKLARFFGGSTTKKRLRLVMVTTSGRVVLAPAGGEEKRAKQELSLLAPDCTWRSQTDMKGQVVWCVDTGGFHYTFEEPKPLQNTNDSAASSVDEWMEVLGRAKDLALSQKLSGAYNGDTSFGEMSSAMSSPTSTLGGRSTYPEGFGITDRGGRHQLTKSQISLDDTASTKRNRFSKRQSKNGLQSAF